MFQQNYPTSNILKVNQNNTYYIYTIIKEGFYPSNNILHYTSARNTNQFKIPDDYVIQTGWGRGISRHMVQCEINYIDSVPVFIIRFGENFQNYVSSITSATNTANTYLQVDFI
jgi:hypothetical protein